MEREILLRSWNSLEKKFYYFSNGRYYSDYELKVCISERICTEFNWENAEWFTGLLDKNEKKIFEGDIVKGLGVFSDVVIFENGYFSWDKSPLTIDFDDTDEIQDTKRWAEVIGTIHDNPELVK